MRVDYEAKQLLLFPHSDQPTTRQTPCKSISPQAKGNPPSLHRIYLQGMPYPPQHCFIISKYGDHLMNDETHHCR